MNFSNDKKTILNQIVLKGGLLGACAALYINDEEKGDLYLRECADNCDKKLAQDLWGADLIAAIKKYTGANKRKRRAANGFDLKVIKVVKILRGIKGKKQEALAIALKITASNYNKIEKGTRALTLGQFYTIALELNMPPQDILVMALNDPD